MDSPTPPPPAPLSTPSRPKGKLWLIIIIIAVIIGLGLWFWLKPNDENPSTTTTEQQAIEQIFKATQEKDRISNLVGIHLLLEKYRLEHKSYPNQLSDLTDIKGYAPGVAKMIAEAKLDNGQPAYTYTKSTDSYQLCANKISGTPQCEGPKK
jgi:Tfp pilus assembly protein PilO